MLRRLALEDLFLDRPGRDKPVDETWSTRRSSGKQVGKFVETLVHSFFCPSRQTRARACWSAAGFQSIVNDSESRFTSHLCCSLTWIEQYQTVRTDEVDTTPSRFTTQKKDELLALGIIELVHQLLSFADGHRAVQAEVAISIGRLSLEYTDMDSKKECLRAHTSCFSAAFQRYQEFGYNC